MIQIDLLKSKRTWEPKKHLCEEAHIFKDFDHFEGVGIFDLHFLRHIKTKYIFFMLI